MGTGISHPQLHVREHRLAFLYQLHYRILMATTLVAHPETIVMHEFSQLKNSIEFYSLRYFLVFSNFHWRTASVLCTKQNALHAFSRQNM